MTNQKANFWRSLLNTEVNQLDMTGLSQRVLNGTTAMLNAERELDVLVTDAVALWRDPKNLQAIAYEWWIVHMFWRMATAYLDAMPRTGKDGKSIVPQAHKQCEELCEVAEKAGNEVILHRSQADAGLTIPRPYLRQPPSFVTDKDTYPAVWATMEAIYLSVKHDSERLRDLVPKQFVSTLKVLDQETKPNLAMCEHFQEQWLLAQTDEVKLQIIQDMTPHTHKLFMVAQKWWRPQFLDSAYEDAFHQGPTLEDLGLPFDAWAITDPYAWERYERDPQRVNELIAFWMENPNPSLAMQLYGELLKAHKLGKIRYYDDNYFPYCPWAPMWVVWKPVTIAGVNFQPFDLCTLYVGTNADDEYVTEIKKVGVFKVNGW